MYSGTTFRRDSGRIVGAHQKIDRVARRRLEKHIPDSVTFPRIGEILHFEGKNGPDGVKLKSPGKDELDHSIDPTEPLDRILVTLINDNIHNLSQALKNNDQIRASFEAAWLAHAIVDGLTPAHHFPLNEKIKEMLVQSDHERLEADNQHITYEFNRKDAMMKKWESWGTGGVMAHIMFELGVASVLTTDRYDKKIDVTEEDLVRVAKYGYEKVFMDAVHKIYALKMYDTFCKKGWSRRLAMQAKKILIPEIIKSVTLAWYQAILLAESK